MTLFLKSIPCGVRLSRMTTEHARCVSGGTTRLPGVQPACVLRGLSGGAHALSRRRASGWAVRFGLAGAVGVWALAFTGATVLAQPASARGPQGGKSEDASQPKPEPQVLKAGLVGPKDSPWSQVFSALDRTLRHQSKGEVSLELSPLGLEVDEVTLVSEATFDVLALTSTGACALDDGLCPRPGVKSAAKVLASPELAARLAKQGWVLLGGGVAGAVHLFSTEVAAEEKPSAPARAWVMRGEEPLYTSFFKKRGASVVVAPLAEAPVVLKKRSPLIFASTPLAVVYFQWHPELKRYSEAPIGDFLAVTVLRQAKWASLSPEGQRALKEAFAKANRILLSMLQKKSSESLNVLSTLGLKPAKL